MVFGQTNITMKKLILLLVCVAVIHHAHAQNPYSDALKLAGYIEPGSSPPRFIIPGNSGDSARQSEIMKKYCDIINIYYNNKFSTCVKLHQGVGSYMIDGEINPDYNPFLSPFLSPESVQEERKNAGLGGTVSAALSSLGGLDVTNIAYGLADFLVKRTKEELNVAFFSRFRDMLNNPKFADLKTLFPNTWELLDAIGDGIYDYNKYLQNLREAFLTDILILDQSLPGIIPNHQEFFNKHFGLAVGVNTACYLTASLKSQVHPGEILDQYPLDLYFKKEGETEYFNKNWSGAIQTLQLISQSLRDTSEADGNYWVSLPEVRSLLNNRNAFKLYLGLIYQVAKSERFNNIQFKQGSFVTLLDSVNFDRDYPAYKGYISNFAIKVNNLNQMIKNFSKPSGDSMAVENYAQYFKSSVDLLEYCTKASTLPHFDKVVGINLHTELQNYFKITGEITDLAIDINRENYSSAINHTVAIYNLIQTKPLEADFNASSDNAILESSLKLSKETLEKLARYGAFMSTVAMAKNSAEVETAIEAAALPSGSSRIKRETPFNVSFNAYTGLFIGYEKIIGMTQNKFEINNFGVAAPVGVSVSTGGHSFLFLSPRNEGHWSYSAFFSLIDLGAVASFRFQNSDSVSQVPVLKLQDIFSPGLFLSIGFPKCPLSFNLGAQVGPNLRNVSVTENGAIVNKYQDNVYWRFSAALVVDIPIFNFYTKSKN